MLRWLVGCLLAQPALAMRVHAGRVHALAPAYHARPLGACMAASVDALLPPTALKSLEVCRQASRTKAEDGDAVVDALLTLEKECRAAAKKDNGALSRATLAALNGAWRLVFTTGTVEMQKKVSFRLF